MPPEDDWNEDKDVEDEGEEEDDEVGTEWKCNSWIS